VFNHFYIALNQIKLYFTIFTAARILFKENNRFVLVSSLSIPFLRQSLRHVHRSTIDRRVIIRPMMIASIFHVSIANVSTVLGRAVPFFLHVRLLRVAFNKRQVIVIGMRGRVSGARKKWQKENRWVEAKLIDLGLFSTGFINEAH